MSQIKKYSYADDNEDEYEQKDLEEQKKQEKTQQQKEDELKKSSVPGKKSNVQDRYGYQSQGYGRRDDGQRRDNYNNDGYGRSYNRSGRGYGKRGSIDYDDDYDDYDDYDRRGKGYGHNDRHRDNPRRYESPKDFKKQSYTKEQSKPKDDIVEERKQSPFAHNEVAKQQTEVVEKKEEKKQQTEIVEKKEEKKMIHMDELKEISEKKEEKTEASTQLIYLQRQIEASQRLLASLKEQEAKLRNEVVEGEKKGEHNENVVVDMLCILPNGKEVWVSITSQDEIDTVVKNLVDEYHLSSEHQTKLKHYFTEAFK